MVRQLEPVMLRRFSEHLVMLRWLVGALSWLGCSNHGWAAFQYLLSSSLLPSRWAVGGACQRPVQWGVTCTPVATVTNLLRAIVLCELCMCCILQLTSSVAFYLILSWSVCMCCHFCYHHASSSVSYMCTWVRNLVFFWIIQHLLHLNLHYVWDSCNIWLSKSSDTTTV